jgi:hypothetical protein
MADHNGCAFKLASPGIEWLRSPTLDMPLALNRASVAGSAMLIGWTSASAL